MKIGEVAKELIRRRRLILLILLAFGAYRLVGVVLRKLGAFGLGTITDVDTKLFPKSKVQLILLELHT